MSFLSLRRSIELPQGVGESEVVAAPPFAGFCDFRHFSPQNAAF